MSEKDHRSAKKFGAQSTAQEVIEGHNLDGREAIVTGGASGIGVETVRALALAGARVVIATRDVSQRRGSRGHFAQRDSKRKNRIPLARPFITPISEEVRRRLPGLAARIALF